MSPAKNKPEYYQALLDKNPNYEGIFYVGVKTTGVFCRPTCPARKPKFENCEFFETSQQALLASFRPCKRCRPLSHPNQVPELIATLVTAVEENPEKRWKERDFQELSVGSQERLALRGDNGSGKTTLIKAILGDQTIARSGQWHAPSREDIGYLDQHYSTLNPQKTVLEAIHDLVSTWSHEDIRRHLNDFLFRKNEEVNSLVSTLSGGEKARLSLAQIAAKAPKLLILDEITNNLDLETRDHIIQVLTAYPGAMIVISHDEDFLRAIHVGVFYGIENNKLIMRASLEAP